MPKLPWAFLILLTPLSKFGLNHFKIFHPILQNFKVCKIGGNCDDSSVESSGR
jgi:hypothetical protein